MDAGLDIENVIFKLESQLTICRVCLEICEQYIEFESPLCAVDGQDITYSDGFNELTTSSIGQLDKSPTNFCVNCGRDLLNAFLFLKRIENANFILNQAKLFIEQQSKHDEEYVSDAKMENITENLNVTLVDTTSFIEETSEYDDNEDDGYHLDQEFKDCAEAANVEMDSSIDTSIGNGTREVTTIDGDICDPLEMRTKNDLYQIAPPNTPKAPTIDEIDESSSDESSVENFFQDGDFIWKCDECEKICESKNHLTEHRKMHDSKKKALSETDYESGKKRNQCLVCKRYCLSGPHFLDHLNVHSGEKPYSCNICMHTFHTQHNLVLHEWRTHKNPGRRKKGKRPCSPVKEYVDDQTGKTKFICSFCGKHCITKCGLKAHALSHTRSEFACHICGKICLTQFTLKRHIGYMHLTNRMKYQCEDCGLFFQYPSLLKDHQRIHDTNNLFQCPHCDKTFSRKFQMELHIRYHNNDYAFKCEQCDKCYVTERKLLDHVKTKHTDVIYGCDKCDQKFKSEKGLKKHRYTHTGFPYNCPICCKGQAARSGMKGHMLRVHEGDVSEEEFNKMFPIKFPRIRSRKSKTLKNQ